MRAILIVCLCAFASVGRAQTTSAPATAPAPDYLQHFSKDYRTLAVIPDPLPNLQRVLTNPRLGQIWREGKLTTFMRKHRPQDVLPSLDAVWMMVLQNHRWVPSEIVMGMPETAWRDFDHVARLAIIATIFQAADQDTEGQKLIPKLQDQLLAEMKDLHLPPVRIWVKFRAEEDCTSLFELISEFALGWRDNPDFPLDVQADETSLRVVMDTAKVLPTKEDRVGTLNDFDLITGDDDPKTDALTDALAKLKFEASLERHGDGLLLTFGRTPKGAALTTADLGPLHVNDDRTVFFGTWDIRSLVTSLKGLNTLWQEWADSELGETLVAFDEEDFGGDLRAMARQLDSIPPVGASRLWGDDNAIRFRMLQEHAPQTPALVTSPVAALIPADIEGVGADTVSTLAERVAGSLGQFEVKLAQQEVRQAIRGQTQAEEIAKAYYESFDPLRQFINHESQAMFKPGVAFLYGGTSMITRATIGPSKNPRDHITVKNLPVIGVAAIAAPATEQQGTQYIQRLYGESVKGTFDATEQFRKNKDAAAPAIDTLTKQEDLGLGVPTWTFDLAWLKTIAPDFTYEIEGDVRPHYFMHEGALVFSTSPKLSQRMLAAARARKTLNLAGEAQNGTLVAYGHAPGSLMVRLFDDIAKWVDEVVKSDLAPPATKRARPTDDDTRDMISGMGEFFGLIEKIHWKTIQSGDQRNTDGGVTFTP